MNTLSQRAAENLKKVRENKPLIHNITNYVVMNFTANALLAAGASPVMAHAENEVEEMVSFAGALVLNIGTLSDPWVSAMLLAARKASEQATPIILDPVGSGATLFRTRTARMLIDESNVSIVRGNASEILSLRQTDARTKGVDARHSVEEAADNASALAAELGAVLAITGPVDLLTNGKQLLTVANGHSLMPYVTGTGCAATALIGAFAAVDSDPLIASAAALAFFGLAGEKAARTADAPGSFMTALLDALYTISPAELEAGARIEAG